MCHQFNCVINLIVNQFNCKNNFYCELLINHIMVTTNFIIVLVIICIIALIFFRKSSIEKLTTGNIIPETAAEACKKISSRAEEITAAYSGQAKVLQNLPIYSLFNPNNYRAGDTSSNDIMRNIINSTMTQEDITKISNSCNPLSTSIQKNIINVDLRNCPYCDTNPCKISMSNISQQNIDEVTQICMLQTAIEILLQNKKSIDAQALAQTLQKTQDLLSGKASSSKDNCNIINSSMTSESYLESIQKCALESQNDQENRIDAACASSIDIVNVIQENRNKKFQECIINATVDKALLSEEDVKATVKAESKQESIGLNPLFFAGSSSISCIISIIIGGALYFYKNNNQ